ncbi:MAG: Maf family protein [Chloracidobacterium sp.]|nr:Maf family protein [Chloracidobacterium sp.]MDW8217910.1 Maf family protein [Acidobacteriota bacterium]
MKLILASASPRRAELLAAAGYAFEIYPTNTDETPQPSETPEAYVQRLALAKARAVVCSEPAVILGADTTVVLDGDLLGKPADAADAARMLRRLSGRQHEVVTGVAVRRVPDDVYRLTYERTLVTFDDLSEDWIANYIASGEPFGKAGAYAIQGRAGARITRIEGNYQNVVGLPVSTVIRLLSELGSTATGKRADD